jgi:LysM repeat protein
MSTYRIQSGDTLSRIAQRNHTSVSALKRANPQIRNIHRISAGERLNLPGSRDEFVPHRNLGVGSRPAVQPGRAFAGTAAPSVAPSNDRRAGASRAFDVARQYVGWNAGDLKRSGNAVGRVMQDWVPNNKNCANFVSGALVASGQLPASRANASVHGLMNNLDRDSNFRRVSLRDARPGDVVSMKTRGGQHVVMFAGWKGGRPVFLGSNNINRDGSQQISYRQMNYPIMAVHQYRG